MSRDSRRVRIDLAYDGTDYCGWQLQPNARTVQGVVETALAELHGGRRIALRAASRTDSGVHAHAQVADCVVGVDLDDAALGYALGRLLPADVRPLCIRTVPDEFHSRKHALRKCYRYRIDRTRRGDPFTVRYALHHPASLDDARLGEALTRLPGRRDWTGFTTPRSDKENPVRELTAAVLEGSSASESVLVFEADGFLRYMVRNIVGTLIEIGKGRMPVERVSEILDRRDSGLAGPCAPAHGLHLWRIDYARPR